MTPPIALLDESAAITAPPERGARPSPTGPGRWRRWTTRLQRALSFAMPLGASLPAAVVLVLHYHSFADDARSRLANGYYVFYSRDPHLAAVGFVWNPLPSFMDMPLAAAKAFWPVLASDAFASNIVSCLCYSLAAWQIYRFLEDLELSAGVRWALWAAFTLNPLVFLYAINGMSEAGFILFLVLTARMLAQWLDGGGTRALVWAGFWLGVAYIDRNEAAASALLALPVVLAAGFLKAGGTRRDRRWAALTDGVLFIAPFVLSFGLWALISYIIVGHPFEQFSSVYGNAAQVRSTVGGPSTPHTEAARLNYALYASLSVAPLLALVAALSVVRGALSRDARTLAVASVIGGVVAFEIVAFATGQLFPWYRYYIYAVPAVVMFAGCFAVPLQRPSDADAPLVPVVGWIARPFRWLRRWTIVRATSTATVGMLAVVLVAPGLLTTYDTLATPKLLTQLDRQQFAYFLTPTAPDAGASYTADVANWRGTKQLSRDLDALHLGHGQLMVDNFTYCIPTLVLDSTHPKQYAIPNDQDYMSKLGVPYQYGVRYFLVPDDHTNPRDALNRQYPHLYEDGQGLATLVREVKVPNCPTFRLYKLVPQFGSPQQADATGA